MKYPPVIILSILILSCASPQKNFEKGNFERAYNGALNELEDGKRKKNKDILNRSFNEMLKAHQTDYELLIRTGELKDWERAYQKREELIVKYVKGKRWLSDDFDAQLGMFAESQEQLAVDIATDYTLLGDNAMDAFNRLGDKLAAQDAFAFYNKVLEYDNDNPQIVEARNYALEAGTIFVYFEADAWDFSHEWDIDRQFKNIERQSDGFFQIFFEEDIPNADCRLEVDFNSLDISTSQETEVKDFTKRIQDGYETVRDTSGQTKQEPVYIEVQGSVSITTEYKNYFWEARVKSNRNTNYCDFSSRTFDTRFRTQRELYTVSGDERAIPREYTRSSDEDFKDDEDDIIEDMIEDIYNDVVRYYF